MGFSRILKSFAYAEHRFDSRKRPLFRLFRLLPLVIDLLEEVSAAVGPFGEEDRAWAAALLQEFGGDEGYCRVVGSAVAADALVMAWPLIKVADQACADFALEAPAAAQCLATLKLMLCHGGIFLPDASETLTHCALHAVKERQVSLGRRQKLCNFFGLYSSRLATSTAHTQKIR